MKVALISDIHGNHVALETVLEDLNKLEPDKLICLGDTATIGPQPKQVLATLQRLDCIFIQGNHDAAVLTPEKASDYNIHPALYENLHWTVSELSKQDTSFMASFQFSYEMDLDDGKSLLCFHASPQANTDNILATTAVSILDDLFEGTNADVMAGGHTHMQMMRKFHGRLLINPGSVGTSFTEPPPNNRPLLSPWAEYAIVESHNGAIHVNFRRLPMDAEAVYAAVRSSSMPNGEWWLEQYR